MSFYSDTIVDLGGADEMANYGEYSGAPSETQTFEYAKTILKLMTDGEPHTNGNFTFEKLIAFLSCFFYETYFPITIIELKIIQVYANSFFSICSNSIKRKY